jgi:dTDP-4-amino-4,6-dideoxygalactose transaminase
MFVPTFQGLTAVDFLFGAPGATTPGRYPFDVPHLTFYRARNAIYYLFKALKSQNERLSVLVPDYNSGNEVLALEAAGVTIHYMPVAGNGQLDVAEVDRLCRVHRPDVLYVIHYLGWPQPIRPLADVARSRGMWLVEDCALALLSDAGTQPLGTFGDWSIFCLYKTLPLPNGACLVENTTRLSGLENMPLRQAGLPSVLGRTAELMVRNLRSRADTLGAAMESMKRAAGRAAGAMDVPRAKIGDIGFNIDEVDLAMSDISARLLRRLDLENIRSRRIENYHRLARQLAGRVTLLHDDLPPGACPLMLPVLVEDKQAAAEALRADGVDVLEFWNHGARSTELEGAHARCLRRHVLGLPIHQDLTARHIDYLAAQVLRLLSRRADALRHDTIGALAVPHVDATDDYHGSFQR